MNIIVYDTETTGLHYGFKNRTVADSSHPRLVQLSALIVDTEARRVAQSMNLVVCPNGWQIPPEATAVHGITQDYAERWGQDEKAVLDIFLNMWAGGEAVPLERVAHNAQFDKNIIATAIGRYYGEGDLLDTWMATRDFCTMLTAKPIVQARTVKGALKYPSLVETHKHFFGEDFDRAHTANADVVATMNVYFALLEQQ